jgi:hypothetical protein
MHMMSITKLIEGLLVMAGAILGAAGAALLEPIVIAVGVVAAVVGAYMRFHEVSEARKRQHGRVAVSST